MYDLVIYTPPIIPPAERGGERMDRGINMDFTFTEEHEMLRELARKFADEELRPRAAKVDEEGDVTREVIDMIAEMGLLGLRIRRDG